MFILLAVFVTITGSLLGIATATIKALPSVGDNMRPHISTQVYDVKGRLIGIVNTDENRVPVKFNKLPNYVKNAFIASEDVRFYSHFGLDIRGMTRAAWSNLTGAGLYEGASTITQQLARNTLLTHDRTLKRKIKEIILSIQIEQKYTKDEILEMYLNQIYFGKGAYGLQSAAQIYFGKNAEDLTLAEASMLAGIPRSPNYYSPSTNMKAAKEVQNIVLDQLVKYNYISAEQAQQARGEEIVLASNHSNDSFASYFIEYITQQLVDRYGAEQVFKAGVKVYTTLDIDAQKAAEQAIKQIPTYRTDTNGTKQPQVSIVAIDPNNGYIKAMVGGRGDDHFNRAVMAERQPGSSFKPFVYLTALENGFSAATYVSDSPISIDDWSPSNYDGKYRGTITLRQAIEKSINTIAVKLAQKVGIDKVLRTAQTLGLTGLSTSGPASDLNLASALGGLTNGVTPLQMASAYATIANMGIKSEPMAILKVEDRNGKLLGEFAPNQQAVYNPKTIYILIDMMKGVIARGTGTAADIGRPAAGKTGTTSNYVDAWFVGFTPDLVCSVWMGQDNNASLQGITGGDTPAMIWHDFMKEALKDIPVRDFLKPEGLVSAETNPNAGIIDTSELNNDDRNPKHLTTAEQARENNVPSERTQQTHYSPPKRERPIPKPTEQPKQSEQEREIYSQTK
ncbi:MAG: penicillin-binding protein, family [Firmicutes bacterium]|nr:penicillin-binding protein, family [Bacillota bacterium]